MEAEDTIPGDRTPPPKPLRWYRSLATRKGRLGSGVFLVEGDRAIRQIASSSPNEIIEVVSTREPPPLYDRYPVRIVTYSQLRSISFTRTPQGIIAIVRLPGNIYSDRLPSYTGAKVLLLEDVQDPGNVGTLIRTAVAFDFSGIILTEKCADPFSPKCVQSTAGKLLSLWMRRTSRYLELVRALKKRGYALVATALVGIGDLSVLQQDRLLLALGNEASGLSDSLLGESDFRLRIPTVGAKAESLNVAACGAICMYLSGL
jgi:TrmH family RNA methyltransferase